MCQGDQLGSNKKVLVSYEADENLFAYHELASPRRFVCALTGQYIHLPIHAPKRSERSSHCLLDGLPGVLLYKIENFQTHAGSDIPYNFTTT